MRLELGHVLIKDVTFGDTTKLQNGVLTINKSELLDLIKEDEHLATVDIDIAKPGESVRITPVKDVVEPRVKVEGPGGVFPGILSKVDVVGSGKTNVLKGCTVMTTGKIVGFQEGIVDMTGPGADYTPFSKTNNVVLICEPIEGLKQHDHERAVRLAGFKAAAYLAEAAKTLNPDTVEVYETLPFLEGIKKYP